MISQSRLPSQFESLVRSLLHQDEKLIAWRCPDRVYCILISGVSLTASLAITAPLLPFLLSLYRTLGMSFWLSGAIVSAALIAPLIWLLLAQWWHVQRVLFLLTTQRAICCIPRLLRHHQIFELRPEHIGSLWAWGIGNIIGSVGWKAAGSASIAGMRLRVRNVGFGLVRAPLDLRQQVIEVLAAQLLTRLKEQDNAVRREAIASLAELAKTKSVSIHVLAEALRSEDSFIRAHAAKTLGTLGKAALPSLPALRIAALDESQAVAQAALRAIEQVSQAA